MAAANFLRLVDALLRLRGTTAASADRANVVNQSESHVSNLRFAQSVVHIVLSLKAAKIRCEPDISNHLSLTSLRPHCTHLLELILYRGAV